MNRDINVCRVKLRHIRGVVDKIRHLNIGCVMNRNIDVRRIKLRHIRRVVDGYINQGGVVNGYSNEGSIMDYEVVWIGKEGLDNGIACDSHCAVGVGHAIIPASEYVTLVGLGTKVERAQVLVDATATARKVAHFRIVGRNGYIEGGGVEIGRNRRINIPNNVRVGVLRMTVAPIHEAEPVFGSCGQGDSVSAPIGAATASCSQGTW